MQTVVHKRSNFFLWGIKIMGRCFEFDSKIRNQKICLHHLLHLDTPTKYRVLQFGLQCCTPNFFCYDDKCWWCLSADLQHPCCGCQRQPPESGKQRDWWFMASLTRLPQSWGGRRPCAVGAGPTFCRHSVLGSNQAGPNRCWKKIHVQTKLQDPVNGR